MTDVQALLRYFKEKAGDLWDRLKPAETDHLLVQVLKMPFKIIAVLLVALLSPVAVVVLILAFVVTL